MWLQYHYLLFSHLLRTLQSPKSDLHVFSYHCVNTFSSMQVTERIKKILAIRQLI